MTNWLPLKWQSSLVPVTHVSLNSSANWIFNEPLDLVMMWVEVCIVDRCIIIRVNVFCTWYMHINFINTIYMYVRISLDVFSSTILTTYMYLVKCATQAVQSFTVMFSCTMQVNIHVHVCAHVFCCTAVMQVTCSTAEHTWSHTCTCLNKQLFFLYKFIFCSCSIISLFQPFFPQPSINCAYQYQLQFNAKHAFHSSLPNYLQLHISSPPKPSSPSQHSNTLLLANIPTN